MSAETPRIDRAFEVVGFAGSLRRASYNRALLRVAAELAAPTLHVTIHDLGPIPLYNPDVEAAGFRAALRNSAPQCARPMPC
jgi:NAD(P)H-dependent FMN reductase